MVVNINLIIERESFGTSDVNVMKNKEIRRASGLS